MKFRFWKRKKSKMFYFKIDNIDEAQKHDSGAVDKFEERVLKLNAFSAGLCKKDTFCIWIEYINDPLKENPNFSIEKVLKILKNIGFKAHFKGEE
jgi:hypothetical protein